MGYSMYLLLIRHWLLHRITRSVCPCMATSIFFWHIEFHSNRKIHVATRFFTIDPHTPKNYLNNI